MKTLWLKSFLAFSLLVVGVGSLSAKDDTWLKPSSNRIVVANDGAKQWRVSVPVKGEYTLESKQMLAAKPGDTFAVHLGIRVDTTTKAMPELVCYDAVDKEITARSALANAPDAFSTN